MRTSVWVWVLICLFSIVCVMVAHDSVDVLFGRSKRRGSELVRDTRNVLGVLPDQDFFEGEGCGSLCLGPAVSREWLNKDGDLVGEVKDVMSAQVKYVSLDLFSDPYGILMTLTEDTYGAVCIVTEPADPIEGDVVRCALVCEEWSGEQAVVETIYIPYSDWKDKDKIVQ